MPASVYLKVFLATFLWGSAFPVGKLCLQYAEPFALSGLRFTLAGMLLLLISLRIDRSGPLKQRDTQAGIPSVRGYQWPRVLLIGMMSTCVFYGLFFQGVKLTSASSAAAVDAAGPIIGSLMAHFVLHQDKLTRRRLSAIGLAFTGILIVALTRTGTGISEVNPVGCLLIVLGLCFSSAGTMLVITYRGRLSLLKLTGFQMCFGGSLLLGISWFTEGWMLPVKAHSLLFAAMLGWLALVSAVAFSLWYGLLRQYKVTSLSVFFFLTQIWGIVLSIAVLGDPVTIPLLLGAGLVIAGVTFMNRDKSPHAREIPPDAMAGL